MNLKSPNKSGFTLLEVLIAMCIMVFISLAIFQATTQTYKLRETLAIEGNFYNSIRLTVSLLQRDIAAIYTPTNLLPTQNNTGGGGYTGGGASPNLTPEEQQRRQQNQEALASGDLARPFIYWSPAINVNGIRPSHFIGSDNKLSFVSVSHIRIYKDSPESEFAKIKYELKKDDNRDAPGTMVLVKTESPNVFATDDVKDLHVRSYEMLRGIKTFQLFYYQKDGNTFKKFSSWDSDKEDVKNRLPEIIEMKIEVVGPRNLSFDGLYKFRPEIPFEALDPSL